MPYENVFGNNNHGVDMGINNGNSRIEISNHSNHYYGNDNSHSNENSAPQFWFFPENDEYVSRPRLEKDLERMLKSKSSRVALTGLAGIGKSSLALHAAQTIQERSPKTHGFYINARTNSDFDESIEAIARTLPSVTSSNQMDAFETVHNWLRDGRNTWFILLDDADLADLFESFWKDWHPSNWLRQRTRMDIFGKRASGSILMTTRRKDFALKFTQQPSQTMIVGPMDPQEGRRLLEIKLPEGDLPHQDSEIDLLLKYFQCMPSPLIKAAGYIEEERLHTLDGFISKLQGSDLVQRNLLRFSPRFESEEFKMLRDRPAPLPIWKYSIRAMEERSPREMLLLLYLFGDVPIPEIVLRNHPWIERNSSGMFYSQVEGNVSLFCNLNIAYRRYENGQANVEEEYNVTAYKGSNRYHLIANQLFLRVYWLDDSEFSEEGSNIQRCKFFTWLEDSIVGDTPRADLVLPERWGGLLGMGAFPLERDIENWKYYMPLVLSQVEEPKDPAAAAERARMLLSAVNFARRTMNHDLGFEILSRLHNLRPENRLGYDIGRECHFLKGLYLVESKAYDEAITHFESNEPLCPIFGGWAEVVLIGCDDRYTGAEGLAIYSVALLAKFNEQDETKLDRCEYWNRMAFEHGLQNVENDCLYMETIMSGLRVAHFTLLRKQYEWFEEARDKAMDLYPKAMMKGDSYGAYRVVAYLALLNQLHPSKEAKQDTLTKLRGVVQLATNEFGDADLRTIVRTRSLTQYLIHMDTQNTRDEACVLMTEGMKYIAKVAASVRTEANLRGRKWPLEHEEVVFEHDSLESGFELFSSHIDELYGGLFPNLNS